MEMDPVKRRSMLFRQDNRFQLLTYLLYLQMLATSRKSVDLNEYLQSELGRNFNLGVLAHYIRSHDLDNGRLYFRVISLADFGVQGCHFERAGVRKGDHPALFGADS
jgi:hypothetical protein